MLPASNNPYHPALESGFIRTRNKWGQTGVSAEWFIAVRPHMVHEIFGLHAYIQDLCRRLAKSGYLAIAPDLYQRQGDVSRIEQIQDIIEQVLMKVREEMVSDTI